MLNHANTRVVTSQIQKLSSTVTSVREGALLASVIESGLGVVKPTDGNSGQIIAGVARSQVIDPTEVPMVEEFVVPASPYQVTLKKTPLTPATRSSCTIAGSAGVYDTTPDATLDYFVTNAVAEFHSSDVGKAVIFRYRYAPTLAEVQMLFGQGIGDAAQSVTGNVEVITSAQVLTTDCYDPASNWNAGGAIYSGADGILTLATSGTLISMCYVLEAPSAANQGFLSVYLSI